MRTIVSRSCTASQPTVTTPCSLSVSPRSPRIRPAIAVELIDVNAPRKRASRLDQPRAMPIAQPIPIDAATCAVPPIATSGPTRRISWNETWTPIENIRKITPRSASELTIPISATSPGVRGPIAMPARM